VADGSDRCPRCGGAFHCGAIDAAPCPCAAVVIDPALQHALRERFTGCLCVTCLRALATGAAFGATHVPREAAR
jgi:Cysteine-rich CWC